MILEGRVRLPRGSRFETWNACRQSQRPVHPALRSDCSPERTNLHQLLPTKTQQSLSCSTAIQITARAAALKSVSSVIFLSCDSLCTLNVSVDVAESLGRPPREFPILNCLLKNVTALCLLLRTVYRIQLLPLRVQPPPPPLLQRRCRLLICWR